MTIDKLYEDLFDTIENNQDLPPYEVGFAMIRLAVKLLYDHAPSEATAKETVEVSVLDGIRCHQEDTL